MRFLSLRNALFRTCLFRTCVFQYLRFQRPLWALSLELAADCTPDPRYRIALRARQVANSCPTLQDFLWTDRRTDGQTWDRSKYRTSIASLVEINDKLLTTNLITPPPMGERSIVMSVSVCLCVTCLSVRDHIFGTTRPIFTKLFTCVTYGRGSVLVWRSSDTLRKSGFMGDDISAHKARLLEVTAQLRRSAQAALGLAINGA